MQIGIEAVPTAHSQSECDRPKNGSTHILPAPVELRLQSTTAVAGGYQVDTNAVHDAGARKFTVPMEGARRFFRIEGCGSTRITNIVVWGTNVVIRYE